MRVLKDAPMATTASNAPPFLSTLHTLRAECVRLVEKHEHETPDRLWRPGDPQARFPKSPKAKACMKLVLNMTTRNNKPEFPPRNTRLSDELVYLATKFLKAADRARDYPYDFDDKGDIDPARVPSGLSPVIWAHGLPFFPVYKGYYILCGREHAKWIGWLLNRKEFQLTKQFPMWSVGPVVASASAVELTRTIDRQSRVHKPLSADDVVGLWEKNPAARDVVSTSHLDLSVVPTFGDGYRLMPICWVAGYNLRCGPDWEDGRAASFVGREIFQKDGVEVLDYEEAWKVDYANERCAEVDSEDSDLSELEEEEDLEMDEQDENVDETIPAGLKGQGHHQNAQKCDAHEGHAKTLDDEQPSSDPEEHDMMLNFIRKRRQESVELGEGHAMHETQNQAEPSTQENSDKNNIPSEVHRATGAQVTKSMFTGLNHSITEHSTTNPGDSQITETVPSGANNSTIQNSTSKPAHAILQAKLSEISERTISSLKRAMAEYRASEGAGDFLLPSAKRQKIFTAETDKMVSIIEGGQGKISAEIHTDEFSTIIIDRSGLGGDAAQGPVSRFKRARAEEPRTEAADDSMSWPSKRPRTAAADTEDEVMSTGQGDGGRTSAATSAAAYTERTSTIAIPTAQGDGARISPEVYAERNATNTIDRPEQDGNNLRGILTSIRKRRAEWKESEGAEDLPFPPAKRQKKIVRFEIDEVMSAVREEGRSIPTQVHAQAQAQARAQAQETSTNIIDRPEQAEDKESESETDPEDHEMMVNFIRKLRQESVECETSTDIPQTTTPIPAETVPVTNTTIKPAPVALRRSSRKRKPRLRIHKDCSAEYTAESEGNTQSTVEAEEENLNPKENEAKSVGATQEWLQKILN